MAFSPSDPASAHSLWLQLRHTKRKRHVGWRSEWTLLWMFFLLFCVLLLAYAFIPPDEAAQQAANHHTLQEDPVQRP